MGSNIKHKLMSLGMDLNVVETASTLKPNTSFDDEDDNIEDAPF